MESSSLRCPARLHGSTGLDQLSWVGSNRRSPTPSDRGSGAFAPDVATSTSGVPPDGSRAPGQVIRPGSTSDPKPHGFRILISWEGPFSPGDSPGRPAKNVLRRTRSPGSSPPRSGRASRSGRGTTARRSRGNRPPGQGGLGVHNPGTPRPWGRTSSSRPGPWGPDRTRGSPPNPCRTGTASHSYPVPRRGTACSPRGGTEPAPCLWLRRPCLNLWNYVVPGGTRGSADPTNNLERQDGHRSARAMTGIQGGTVPLTPAPFPHDARP